VKVLIAGGQGQARSLARAAHEVGAAAAIVAEPPGAARSVAALAQRLRELEASLAAEQPDAVVLADDTDTALAALLVAAKLRVPAAAGEIATSSANGRLIVQLAEQRLGDEHGSFGGWPPAAAKAE